MTFSLFCYKVEIIFSTFFKFWNDHENDHCLFIHLGVKSQTNVILILKGTWILDRRPSANTRISKFVWMTCRQLTIRDTITTSIVTLIGSNRVSWELGYSLCRYIYLLHQPHTLYWFLSSFVTLPWITFPSHNSHVRRKSFTEDSTQHFSGVGNRSCLFHPLSSISLMRPFPLLNSFPYLQPFHTTHLLIFTD